ARSPFTDHKMMELSAQIPYGLKVHNGVNKFILKKALEGLVPRENLYRKKMGFTIPLDKWFTGELREYMISQINSRKSIAKTLFKTSEVKRMLTEHSSKSDYGPKLWSLLTLDLWYQSYFS
ncbi:MAG: asparagine synthase-related protein, partial [Patescibacteria group bacterium]